MFIVDYIQLGKGEGKKGSNREQEVAEISRGLKQIAKSTRKPVVALSQLSRAVETRGGDKKPQLSDLRESGSLEADADVVIFLYRPEYYGSDHIEINGEKQSSKGYAQFIIAKNRNGPTGDVPVRFIDYLTKFMDIEQAVKEQKIVEKQASDILPFW